MRLAKQETLTPPWHLVSLLVCRGPWMPPVLLYCWSYSNSASVFSSPEPKAQVSYCHSAPSVVRPSVVCRPSVRRKLSHFRLLLWNCWTKFNETWQKSRSQRPLPSLCFSSRSENTMAALASDWLRHFRLLHWNRWTEFNETWQEARSHRLLPSLCFLGWLGKKDGRPGLWFAETF